MLFTTIGILSTGMNDLSMETVADVSNGLICLEFERNLGILGILLDDEMKLMADDEKNTCYGSCNSDPDVIYFIDGCDFGIKKRKDAWMWKTHKDNVKGNKAVRAQIICDSQLSTLPI